MLNLLLTLEDPKQGLGENFFHFTLHYLISTKISLPLNAHYQPVPEHLDSTQIINCIRTLARRKRLSILEDLFFLEKLAEYCLNHHKLPISELLEIDAIIKPLEQTALSLHDGYLLQHFIQKFQRHRAEHIAKCMGITIMPLAVADIIEHLTRLTQQPAVLAYLPITILVLQDICHSVIDIATLAQLQQLDKFIEPLESEAIERACVYRGVLIEKMKVSQALVQHIELYRKHRKMRLFNLQHSGFACTGSAGVPETTSSEASANISLDALLEKLRCQATELTAESIDCIWRLQDWGTAITEAAYFNPMMIKAVDDTLAPAEQKAIDISKSAQQHNIAQLILAKSQKRQIWLTLLRKLDRSAPNDRLLPLVYLQTLTTEWKTFLNTSSLNFEQACYIDLRLSLYENTAYAQLNAMYAAEMQANAPGAHKFIFAKYHAIFHCMRAYHIDAITSRSALIHRLNTQKSEQFSVEIAKIKLLPTLSADDLLAECRLHARNLPSLLSELKYQQQLAIRQQKSHKTDHAMNSLPAILFWLEKLALIAVNESNSNILEALLTEVESAVLTATAPEYRLVMTTLLADWQEKRQNKVILVAKVPALAMITALQPSVEDARELAIFLRQQLSIPRLPFANATCILQHSPLLENIVTKIAKPVEIMELDQLLSPLEEVAIARLTGKARQDFAAHVGAMRSIRKNAYDFGLRLQSKQDEWLSAPAATTPHCCRR
jgi:hypothetical protein